jgi:hypothetical protein
MALANQAGYYTNGLASPFGQESTVFSPFYSPPFEDFLEFGF